MRTTLTLMQFQFMDVDDSRDMFYTLCNADLFFPSSSKIYLQLTRLRNLTYKKKRNFRLTRYYMRRFDWKINFPIIEHCPLLFFGKICASANMSLSRIAYLYVFYA